MSGLAPRKGIWWSRVTPEGARGRLNDAVILPIPASQSSVPSARKGKLTMATSGLRGTYPLTNASIDENVTRTSPGAYALGHTSDSSFLVKYVGRSDGNVNARLKDHVGSYKRFKFEYYGSAKAALRKSAASTMTLIHRTTTCTRAVRTTATGNVRFVVSSTSVCERSRSPLGARAHLVRRLHIHSANILVQKFQNRGEPVPGHNLAHALPATSAGCCGVVATDQPRLVHSEGWT